MSINKVSKNQSARSALWAAELPLIEGCKAANVEEMILSAKNLRYLIVYLEHLIAFSAGKLDWDVLQGDTLS